MTQLQFEVDLTEWFIQGTFIASLVFATVYIPFFKWRETITGRATTTLVLSIAGALLHSVLVLWGVTTITKGASPDQTTGFWNQFLTWVAIISLGFACISIATLAFVAVRYLIAESETTNRFLCKVFHLGMQKKNV